MDRSIVDSWQRDIGLDKEKYPSFFTSKSDLTSSVSQAHILRHAFDLLDLDGVFCVEERPLIYFKQVEAISLDEELQLHRKFWNHSGAPILVLISKAHVHIYSGMTRPVSEDEIQEASPALVKTIDRVSEGLQKFIVSVESGEFFRENASYFNPDHRVDHDLLNNLRDTRELLKRKSDCDTVISTLDALLCRLVFTCYLFDRKVIGAQYLKALNLDEYHHLRDILNIQPSREANATLYRLFSKLGEDFNGDLFSDDLEAESRQITDEHIQILNDFFHGTLVKGRQQAFWPYDFAFIPVETISAIYEHFLKDEDQRNGAFYTPRFLAEVVLDSAIEGFDSLLDKKFFDPACGSGIFLVGLFNRIAEEWTQANPDAQNDIRAKELMRLLQENLYGVDINFTACRITAFSLYLAYLDQLTPRDIQVLQNAGRALPRLVIKAENQYSNRQKDQSGNIRCADFFEQKDFWGRDADLVIGNPPWGSFATGKTPAGKWCIEHQKVLPDKQIATAFVWKAVEHVSFNGRVCFVLPHGVLFNHSKKAIRFQKELVSQHTIQRVLNLADLRQFVFNEAIHPAVVVSYSKEKPEIQHRIEYWTPKADWTVTQTEVITVSPLDRTEIIIRDLLNDLNGPDAPHIWNQKYWATPRDLRFIDRLSLYPRLRDHVRLSNEKDSTKPWVRAEGFQPKGANDDLEKAKNIMLPSKSFVQAKNKDIDLFLKPMDCETLDSENIIVRAKSNTNTEIFKAPHVLISKGFQKIAFADFDVSFRHALRGIHGRKEDRNLLIFLTAYLRTPLAKYFMFHTSSNWGIYRPEVHVEEIVRLPMPFPEQLPDKRGKREIVDKVAHIFDIASKQVESNFLDRSNIIKRATEEIEPLIYQYFEIQPIERLLIEDTLNVIIPSIQPTQKKMPVPTVKHSTTNQQATYVEYVCSMLNGWSKKSPFFIRGGTMSSSLLGIGITILEKTSREEADNPMVMPSKDILLALDRLRSAIPRENKSIDPVRGLMVFDKNYLYIVKPIGQRNWTKTAALNDADEIAGTILMAPRKERV